MTVAPPPAPPPEPAPPAPAATNPLAELRARLAELTPRVPVTTALVVRLRTSFACQPDPARDGVLPANKVSVQVDLGPDWGLAEDGKVLGLVTLDGEIYFVVPLPSHAEMGSDAMKAWIPQSLLTTMGQMGVSEATFEAANVAGGPAPLWRGQGTREKRPVRMLATAIRCEANPFLIFYLGPRERPESGALRLLSAARCAATPTRPRPFAELAREACARGDKRGCN